MSNKRLIHKKCGGVVEWDSFLKEWQCLQCTEISWSQGGDIVGVELKEMKFVDADKR